jgi:ubiquinone/menaquinone biosynthesis C-methylase UbiE
MVLPRHDQLTELMDEPNVDPAELAQALLFIRKVNRFLGGTSAVMGHLKKWEGTWPRDRVIRILDVATGSGDIPQAIVKWARATGRRVNVVGLDLHPATLNIARQWVGDDPDITFLQADALAMPVADGAFDVVTCSMFLHHLNEEQALQAIGEMLRVSRGGVIVNDLCRSRWAKAAIYLLTLFASKIDRHDARVSVAKGWVRNEVEKWPAVVGAEWLKYHGHAFSRFTLAGQKEVCC